MPKVNVYLPDKLADEVRRAGLPVSAICQRALERVLREVDGLQAQTSRPSFFGAYGRFLHRARASMELACDAASHRGHNYLGPEHVLIGMLEQGSNFGVDILETLGASPDEVLLKIDELLPRLGNVVHNPSFDMLVSDGLQRVLSLAAREAAYLGHKYIGNEHLLYSLAEEGESPAARVLTGFGVTTEAVRRAHKERVRMWVVADVASLEELGES